MLHTFTIRFLTPLCIKLDNLSVLEQWKLPNQHASQRSTASFQFRRQRPRSLSGVSGHVQGRICRPWSSLRSHRRTPDFSFFSSLAIPLVQYRGKRHSFQCLRCWLLRGTDHPVRHARLTDFGLWPAPAFVHHVGYCQASPVGLADRHAGPKIDTS